MVNVLPLGNLEALGGVEGTLRKEEPPEEQPPPPKKQKMSREEYNALVTEIVAKMKLLVKKWDESFEPGSSFEEKLLNKYCYWVANDKLEHLSALIEQTL